MKAQAQNTYPCPIHPPPTNPPPRYHPPVRHLPHLRLSKIPISYLPTQVPTQPILLALVTDCLPQPVLPLRTEQLPTFHPLTRVSLDRTIRSVTNLPSSDVKNKNGVGGYKRTIQRSLGQDFGYSQNSAVHRK